MCDQFPFQLLCDQFPLRLLCDQLPFQLLCCQLPPRLWLVLKLVAAVWLSPMLVLLPLMVPCLVVAPSGLLVMLVWPVAVETATWRPATTSDLLSLPIGVIIRECGVDLTFLSDSAIWVDRAVCSDRERGGAIASRFTLDVPPAPLTLSSCRAGPNCRDETAELRPKDLCSGETRLPLNCWPLLLNPASMRPEDAVVLSPEESLLND